MAKCGTNQSRHPPLESSRTVSIDNMYLRLDKPNEYAYIRLYEYRHIERAQKIFSWGFQRIG